MPPYIRRTKDNRLLVTVAEPVEHDRHTVGIVLLTREALEVDASLFTVRISILGLFCLALALTVLLSWYLSRTIARPILSLADAARDMREGQGRTGSVPHDLLARRDEVGALATALSDFAQALWARMDAIERFAADVAHEIKNPLSSIRSAIETLRRMDDPVRQRQLLGIIAQDVTRLDRLISDVSDASRLDAELSRITAEHVDVVPMLHTLRELDEATRDTDNDPQLVVDAPPGGLVVLGGGGPPGAGAAQPDRQRAVVQPAARAHLAARPRGGGQVELASRTRVPALPTPIWSMCSTGSIPNARRASGSANIPASACRSAGRSSRRCMAGSAPRTGRTRRGRCSGRGSWCGCRRPDEPLPRCARERHAHRRLTRGSRRKATRVRVIGRHASEAMGTPGRRYYIARCMVRLASPSASQRRRRP